MQTNPAIGMAGSRLQRGEGGDTRGSSGGMDNLQHTRQRLTLPSPSAMLTGALPPRHASSGPSSHFSSHDRTHFSQHSYQYSMSISENAHSSISSNEDISNSHTPNENSHLSTLERNPIAFIAAAGLMQISNDHSQAFHPTPTPTTATRAHVYHYDNHPSLSEVSASGLGASSPSHVNSNSNSYPSIHTSYSHTSPSYLQNTSSPSYPSLRYTPMFATPKPPPVPAPLPPSLLGLHNSHTSGSKGKHKVAGDLPHLEDKGSGREAVKLAWVKHQQKLAKDRERWKQARRKSKIIILRVSGERLRVLENRWKASEDSKQSLIPVQADESEEDLVTTDLAPVKKTPKAERKVSLSGEPGAGASLSKSGRRVAPGWVEISDDEENTSEGGLDEDVGDEEYRGWGARQFSKKRQATMVATKKSRRKVSRPEFFRETLTGSQEQGPSESSGGGGCHDAGKNSLDEGLFSDHQTPVALERSEAELRQLAEEEEAKRKLEEEKRVEQDRQREQEVEEARKRAEEEAKRIRELAEQKAKEEVRQRELENERKRKEEIARAYRESKLLAFKVANGEESLESWGGQEEEVEVDEEVPVVELLPDGMRFAVVVDVEELLAREAYEAFDDVEFTAPLMDSGFSADIPDLDINMETPLPISLASPPPPTKGKRRGRPRKHTAKAPAIATTPSARYSVNPLTSSTPTTTTTFTRKPHRKIDDDDGTFRGSRPRTQKKSIPPTNDPDTATGPKRKRGRPKTTAGRRASAAAKLQSSGASTTDPVRASSRKRKSLIQSYNFDSDEEKKQDVTIPPEMYIDNDDVPKEIIGPINLELDPDVGVLEREERRAKLLKTQRKRSASAITLGKSGDEAGDEPEVKIEEEYNSRWRRRTMKW